MLNNMCILHEKYEIQELYKILRHCIDWWRIVGKNWNLRSVITSLVLCLGTLYILQNTFTECTRVLIMWGGKGFDAHSVLSSIIMNFYIYTSGVTQCQCRINGCKRNVILKLCDMRSRWLESENTSYRIKLNLIVVFWVMMSSVGSAYSFRRNILFPSSGALQM
jgi:hypothetical protein